MLKNGEAGLWCCCKPASPPDEAEALYLGAGDVNFDLAVINRKEAEARTLIATGQVNLRVPHPLLGNKTPFIYVVTLGYQSLVWTILDTGASPYACYSVYRFNQQRSFVLPMIVGWLNDRNYSIVFHKDTDKKRTQVYRVEIKSSEDKFVARWFLPSQNEFETLYQELQRSRSPYETIN